MRAMATCVGAALILGLCVGVSATVHRVPSEYPTIQAGIDAAIEGDTVLVADGSYTGDGNRDLDFGGVNMVVMSENGPEVTIIDCGGDSLDPHRGFHLHSGENLTSVVGGFTIKNGYVVNNGGAILCEDSSPSIMGNILRENTAELCGGGIRCLHCSPIIMGNTIVENRTLNQAGAGIQLHGSSPLIVDNTISDNVSTGPEGGGGIRCFGYASSPLIAGNVIEGNSALTVGGGISCGLDCTPTIEANTISGNSADRGGGISCGDYCSLIVMHSILWADSAATGKEIYLGTSSITITYSNVEGGWPGEGNIDAYPRFVKESWGDYRLRWGSPCIDAGHPDSLDADGTRCDMGADFFDQSKTLVAYMTPEALAVHRGDTLRVRYALDNCHPDSVAARGIVTLTLPNGQPWPGNPLEGPGYGVMPPESNWQHPREYLVPETWPLGITEITWRIGMPGNLFDADSFKVTVVP